MSDYQPTDEQIEAVAALYFMNAYGLEWDTEAGDDHPQFRREAREDFASPAFQSIIRAAQAEALRAAADEIKESAADLDPSHGGELSFINCTSIDAHMLRTRADEIEAADV